jgi:MFS family permease
MSSRPLRWYDTIIINAYYTGLSLLSQTISPLVVPLLVQQFVGESRQGAAYGTIRLWSLMVALLVQSLMGMLSDRSTLRWGRRRPFILAGTLGDLVVIAAIGLTASMDGMSGYWTLFFLIILLMVTTNTAHGAVQGLIPDLVPEEKHGIYSGVKSLLEVPLPLIIVPFTIGSMIASGSLWGGLAFMAGSLVLTMIITMFSPEVPLKGGQHPLNWAPFVRLVGMTVLFTLVILVVGKAVQWIGDSLSGLGDTALLISMGVVGLVAMLLAIAIGVYYSVQIGIGEEARRNPSFTWWIINRLAFLVGSTNIAGFAVYFLQGRLGLARELAVGPATRLLMVVGVAILLLALPGGWLADRFGSKTLVMASGLIAALGTLIAISVPSLTAIYVGGILIGAGTGLFYTVNWALGTSLVPAGQAGRYLGISNLAGAGAGAVGAYIGGPIADYFTLHIPSAPGIGYVLLFAIYGALFLLSIIALRWVHLPAQNTALPDSP